MKLTPLQIETLRLIRDGKVSQQNTGYASWRIFGASPAAVGRVVSLGLAEWGRFADRHRPITLTKAGRDAITTSGAYPAGRAALEKDAGGRE